MSKIDPKAGPLPPATEVPGEVGPNEAQPRAYEPPQLKRLGTLLELTRSGQSPRTEAFRGSR
jgi:hypothetical protein